MKYRCYYYKLDSIPTTYQAHTHTHHRSRDQSLAISHAPDITTNTVLWVWDALLPGGAGRPSPVVLGVRTPPLVFPPWLWVMVIAKPTVQQTAVCMTMLPPGSICTHTHTHHHPHRPSIILISPPASTGNRGTEMRVGWSEYQFCVRLSIKEYIRKVILWLILNLLRALNTCPPCGANKGHGDGVVICLGLILIFCCGQRGFQGCMRFFKRCGVMLYN